MDPQKRLFIKQYLLERYYLKILYKASICLFHRILPNIDKSQFFNTKNNNGCNKILLCCRNNLKNKKNNYSYYFDVRYVNEFIIPPTCGLIAGFYFPNHKNGDVVRIINSYYSTVDSVINITDNSKIYFALNNRKFIFPLDHMMACVMAKYTVPFYAIYIHYDDLGIQRNIRLKCSNNKNYAYAEDASAEIIQRAWRNWKYRSIFNKWKKNIKNINNEILYCPDFGVKYFEAFNDFNKLTSI